MSEWAITTFALHVELPALDPTSLHTTVGVAADTPLVPAELATSG
jgi:hypothetical protein